MATGAFGWVLWEARSSKESVANEVFRFYECLCWRKTEQNMNAGRPSRLESQVPVLQIDLCHAVCASRAEGVERKTMKHQQQKPSSVCLNFIRKMKQGNRKTVIGRSTWLSSSPRPSCSRREGQDKGQDRGQRASRTPSVPNSGPVDDVGIEISAGAINTRTTCDTGRA